MRKLPQYFIVVATCLFYCSASMAMPNSNGESAQLKLAGVSVDGHCLVAGDTLAAAKQSFASTCTTATFRDCDPVEQQWVCADVKVESINVDILQDAMATPTVEPTGGNTASPETTLPIASDVCYSVASTLQSAKQAYKQQCAAKRVDCDPVDGVWVCANMAIESISNLDTGEPVVSVIPEPTQETPSPPDPDSSPEPNTSTDPDISTDAVGVADLGIEHVYDKNEGPFKNPLKGWNSGWDGGNNHPESSVGFQYIPWEIFEPVDGQFDRKAVENIIDNEGSKNRHLILRLFCDWHGAQKKSDCPEWMYTDVGVDRLRGDNGRFITDFNDPAYIAQAQEAIQALAAEFDNDPRIYAVQMGVIGYWGEWHAWGSDFGGNSYDITDETKNAILSAYEGSFSNAKIMARYPWREPTRSASSIGFHNDYFVARNGHSEEFDSAIENGGQWIYHPIGGEVPPRSNSQANNEKALLFLGELGQSVIEAGHYSTMKAGAYRVTEGESGYEGYMRLHKKMGYNYQIDVATFTEQAKKSEQLNVEVIGTNIGVAPMYFDWDVQYSLLDNNNNPIVTERAASDLTSILPGAMFTFSSSLNLNTLNPGEYKLGIRIIQPGADSPKNKAWKLDARNTYIMFSNDLPVIGGKWVNNNLVGGWSVLGNVTVR